MLALSSIFCDTFQTVDTVTIPTFARFVIMATKVCLSGRLEESKFTYHVAHKKSPEIVPSECSHVLLHLELWINFSFQLHTVVQVDIFSEEYGP